MVEFGKPPVVNSLLEATLSIAQEIFYPIRSDSLFQPCSTSNSLMTLPKITQFKFLESDWDMTKPLEG